MEEIPVWFHTTPGTATEQKGSFWIPWWTSRRGQGDDKDCVSSAVRLHTNHRAVAHFRRKLEARLQQTFMHSSTCSCCSFNNASLQFIASCLIAFAVSSILWPLNYVAADWSWGTTGVMVFPCAAQHTSAARQAEGDQADARVMQGGITTLHWPGGPPRWGRGLGADAGAGVSLQKHKGKQIKHQTLTESRA